MRPAPALLLGALLLALLGAAWWLLAADDAGGPGPAETLRGADAGIPPPAGLRTEPGTGPREGDGTAHGARAPAREPAGIRGVVVDERERAIPGARVVVEALDPQVLKGAEPRRGRVLAQGLTGADGAFELPLIEAGWVLVGASSPGHASDAARVPGPDAFVRLVLGAPCTLEVRVLATDGAPVPGALVAAVGGEGLLRAAASGTDGRARFDDLPPGATSVQVGTEDGRRARGGPVTLVPADATPLDVLLPPLVRLAGRVVDQATGAPVADAAVRVAQPGASVEAVTSGDGSFGPVAAGAAGARVLVAVRAAGYADALVPVVLAEGGVTEDEVTVALAAAHPWRGVVVDGASRPVEGAVVAWTADGIEGREPPGTRTDAQGRFELPPPAPPAPGRRVLLEARAAAGVAALAPRPGAPPPRDLRLVLGGGASLAGRVVDGEGSPVAGAVVRLDPLWSELPDRARPGPDTARVLLENETGRLGLTAATGPDGRWRLADVPAARYELRILYGASTTFSEEPFDVAGRDLDLGTVALAQGHALDGTVTDPRGHVLPGVEVLVRAAEGRPHLRRTRTDEEGHWQIDGVADGVWLVAAARPDRQPTTREVEVSADMVVDLVLEDGARVEGRVRDGDAPVRVPFTVELEGEGGRPPIPARTFRDAGGRFRLDGVPAGTWSLRVVASGDRLGVTTPLDVRPGASYVVDVELSSGARLEGVLRGADGEPLRGGRISLTQEGTGRRRVATSEALGRYAAVGLDAGTWRVTARARGGAPVERRVLLAAGETVRVDLDLGPVGALDVVVRGSDGRTRAGAYVWARPRSGPSPAPPTLPRTDAEGEVRLEDVPLGVLDVMARTPEGESGRVEVAFDGSPGEAVEVRVRPNER